MTIADLIKDFIDNAKERIKNPISGAFLWSFILYNWRPIFVLIFSNKSIEDKITVINHTYCNSWAIGGPIILAFIYTLLIPLIMVLIDKSLAPLKKMRISYNYDSKIHTNYQKIKLATEEVILKDIMSGNRSQQELLDRINTLEESNTQRATADKNTIDSLNLKLNEVNNILIEQQTKHKNTKADLTDRNKDLIVSNAYNALGTDFRRTFYDLINSDEKLDLSILPPRIIDDFLKLDLFIKDENNRWLITDIGIRLFNKIHKSQKP